MLAALALLLLQDDLDAQVRRYLDAPDKALAESIAKRPPAEVERAIRACARAFPKRESGVERGKAKNAFDPAIEIAYQAWIPGHDAARRHPLLVSLHGQSGTAEGQMRTWLEDVRKEEGLFLIAPEAARGGWGRSRPGFGNVLGVIRHALASYPIDPLRVYVDGASMGGNGSFQFAYLFPDVVAAAAPRAGGPEFFMDREDRKKAQPRFLENLRNVPVYWIVGVKDEKVPIEWVRAAKEKADALKLDLVYREMDGGHEWFPSENAKVLEWLRGRKREPHPAVVHWITHERIWSRAHWLEITEFSKAADERWQRTYVTDTNEEIEKRLHFVHPVEVRAEIDRATNTVRVTAKHATAIRLHLHDRMLDLDKEVRVELDGRTVAKKKVPRSSAVLLESALRDREALCHAILDVKLK